MSVILNTESLNTARFAEASARVASEEKLSEGFSVYAERAVHKIFKLYIEPNAENHEVPVSGMVADILNSDGITEVQTASFKPLLPKLERLLPEYRVTVIHPFAIHTSHRWLDRETGEISSPRGRGTSRTLHNVARELYSIRHLIGHENLTVRILAYDLEEFRVLDGRGKSKKRGATLLGKMPTALVGELTLRETRDYLALLPDGLPSEFTREDFMRLSGCRSRYGAMCLPLLEHLGLIVRVGKRGRAYLYSKSEVC